MLIINANIKTMEDEDFENGYIAVFDGKIQSVGPMSEAAPDRGCLRRLRNDLVPWIYRRPLPLRYVGRRTGL